MSREIEERVLSMQFDNKNFETNVAQSMSTLDRLKSKLNLKGASQGLENVSAAASKISMNPLASGIETVTAKFSALQVMGVTALANITNQAVNAGKRIISAITIDPVKTGFQEYETQINAVQTILANTQSKGTTLDQVNQALDTLNTYADKTIYNFTEMTRNIGTFTAAGIDLETSVSAIQGIANLAAVSGSTSQQASTAMYQLSQALAAGTVKLMDWNSVVNAGMGGQVFQDALKETSELLGTGAENAIKAKGSFRESLQTGWLTAEVLTETLKKFTTSGANEYVAKYTGLSEDAVQAALDNAKAQYGEADAIEYAAKALAEKSGKNAEEIESALSMARTAEDAATKVKTFTQLIDTLKEALQSGWTQTWEILIGDFEEAKELFTSISDFLGNIINETASARNDVLEGAMTSNWDKLVKSINEAGVETSVFEDKVKEVAKSHGHNVEGLIKEHGSLENAIRNGAISTNVLQEAVDGLNGSLADLSSINRELGLGDTGEDVKEVQKALDGLGYSIGSFGADGILGKDTEAAIKAFQEAKGLEVTGIIDDETLQALKEANEFSSKLGDNVRELIKNIDELGGRELIIESFKNVFKAIGDVLKPIKSAFEKVFPSKSIDEKREKLYGILEAVHKFTEKLKVTPKIARNINKTFTGLFSVVKIGVSFVKSLAGGIAKLFGGFSGLGGEILGVTAKIGDWLTGLRKSIDESNIFTVAVDGIVGVLEKVINAFKQAYGFLKGKIVAPGWEGLLDILSGIWDVIEKIGKKIGEVGSSIGKALSNAFRSGDIKSGLDLVNGGLLAGILLGINKFVNGGFLDKVKDAFTSILEPLDGLKDKLAPAKSLLDDLRGCLEAYQNNLKANILLKIAGAIAILAISLAVVSMIDSNKLNQAVGAIIILFSSLMGAMSAFDKIAGIGGTLKEIKTSFKKMAALSTASTVMIKVAAAVLILSFALKKIADLEWEELGKGLVGVFGLMAIVVGSMAILSKVGGKMTKGAGQMILIAVAMEIFADVCAKIGQLEWGEIGKAIVAIGGILLLTAGFELIAGESKKATKAAFALVIIGAAMEIFADVCKKFGEISWESLGKSGAAIGGILVLAAGFSLLSGYSKKLVKSSLSLVIIGAALEIFTDVCKKFGQMAWEELGKSGAAIGGILLLAAGFTLLSGLSSSLIGSVVSLTIMAAALEIFTDVAKKFGSMEWEELGKAGAAIGGILVLAAGFALIAGLAPGIIGSAAALLIMATALAIFTPVLTTLGSMSWEGIAKGLVAIAAAFTIMGIAGFVLAPVVPVILALSAALLIFGAASLAIGAGIALIAAGLSALTISVTAGATALVAALAIIVSGLIGLIPVIVAGIGEALIILCDVIIQAAPKIGEAIKALVLTLVNVLVECVPALAEGFLKLLTEVMGSLAEYTPQLVDHLMVFLIGLINGIAERLPELIQAAFNLIGQFFQGVIDALSGIDTTSLLKGIAGIGLMTILIYALSALSPLIPGAMAGVLGMGVVIAELALVLAAIGALAQIPGLEWLISEGGDFLQTIGTAIGQFIGGIVGGIAEGATSTLPQVGTNLSDFMTNLTPFIEGAKTIDASMMEGVNTLTSCILKLTGAGLLDSIASWLGGGDSLATFGEQLVPFGTAMKDFSTEVAGINIEALNTSVDAAGKLVDVADSIPSDGIFGTDGIDDFGKNAVKFGEKLKEYGEEVDGINTEAVTTSVKAAKGLVSVAKQIPDDGTFGTDGIDDFGKNVKSFGKSLAEYGEAIADVSLSAINNSITAAKRLINFINSLGGLDASGIGAFKKALSELGTVEVEGFVAAFTSASSKIKTAGSNLLKFLTSGITSAKNQPINAMKSVIEYINKYIRSKAPQFVTIGKQLMTKLNDGLKSKNATLKSTVTSAISEVVAKIKSKYDSFKSAGKYLGSGLVLGIESKYQAAYDAGYELGQKAVQGEKDGQASNSPSKLTMQSGRWFGEGLVIGINKMGKAVYSAAYGLGETATNSVSSAIARISDVINSDVESQPTIRPVLDLSDVAAGAGAINGMFSMTPSVGVLSNVGSIGLMMNRNQNGRNSDVISAIDKLSDKLNTRPGDSYTINGVTYDDGSNISNAVAEIVRQARIERRI